VFAVLRQSLLQYILPVATTLVNDTIFSIGLPQQEHSTPVCRTLSSSGIVLTMSSFRSRYPPPYSVIEIPAPGYKVVDANGVELCFIYADDGRLEVNARFRMNMAEARALAEQIAGLGDT
jgi:hypothetical protein